MRTYNVETVSKATEQYATEIVGFNPEDWLDNPNNIALTNDKGDVALFEHQEFLQDTVCGHYFFFSRGKEAVKVAQEFLEEIFTDSYVKTIVGLTPEDNKGALWMNRRLGFKENGQVETEVGPCRFVTLTKEQWKDSN